MSDVNPYTPPQANTAAVVVEDGGFISGGRKVNLDRAWAWISSGFELFRKQPGMWILLVIVFVVTYAVIGIVPVLGSIANALLGPVFGGGFMLACQAQRQGEGLEIGHLFAGFKRNIGDLVLVGLLSLIAFAVILIPLVMIVGGAGLFAGMQGGQAGLAGMGITAMLVLLMVLAVSVPVGMALWFAPALVVFHEVKPVDALKHSFWACLKNIVPFLVYSVILLVLAVIAAIPFGLGFLVLVPVAVASIYAAYRDIFMSP